MTDKDRKELCKANGGKLAEPQTRDAIDFLKELSKQSGGYGAFLGGTDHKKEGKWVWNSTGLVIEETDWYLNEPNSAGGLRDEDCLMTYRYTYSWADVSCSNKLKYICEKEPYLPTSDVIALEGERIELVSPTSFLMDHLDGGRCPCNCDYRQKLVYWGSKVIPNKTYDELVIELKPVIQKLKAELQINKTKLSSNIRKKTSAPDSRRSSERLGYLGIAFITFIIGLVIIIDIVSIKKFTKQH